MYFNVTQLLLYYECPNQWPSVVVCLILTHSTYMRALWKIDVHLISILVNKSLYYYYYLMNALLFQNIIQSSNISQQVLHHENGWWIFYGGQTAINE